MVLPETPFIRAVEPGTGRPVPSPPRHVCLVPGFIQEYELTRIGRFLFRSPIFTMGFYVHPAFIVTGIFGLSSIIEIR